MKKVFIVIYIIAAFSAKADYWTQKADYPGYGLEYSVSFSIGNKGYVGLGRDTGYNYHNDFWEYDPSTNVWMQKANFPGNARTGMTSLSVLNKGYICNGNDSLFNFLQDIWEYDPQLNSWLQKSNFIGNARAYSSSFVIGTKGYICSGRDVNISFFNDFWEYNPITDSWTQKANLPTIGRVTTVAFSVQGKGYFGTGWTFPNNFYNDIYEYDTLTNIWAFNGIIAGYYSPKSAAAFSIGNKGFVGTGKTPSLPPYSNYFWQFDPLTNQWIKKADFSGAGREAPACFSINCKGYIGLGGEGSNPLYKDFWEYTPDSITCITGITESPSSDFNFEINPNPAKEFIVCSLQFTVEKKIELTITNSEGKKVYSLQLETENRKQETKIDISNFSKGIYFVKAISLPFGEGRGGAVVKKFLKN
jgi:N-acetylneuraminic acid mutarotase